METLKQRLEEQHERHQGGNKWIGTAGTSPFGAYGYNPEGVRIGQDRSRQPQRREGLGPARVRESSTNGRTRHAQHENGAAQAAALRAARRPHRTRARRHHRRDGALRRAGSTSRWFPSATTSSRCCCCSTSGGSMDDHVRVCEELFSAARSEFKHLEHFYFHNCPYEALWRDNRRRFNEHVEHARGACAPTVPTTS